jgi:hypothetical protein
LRDIKGESNLEFQPDPFGRLGKESNGSLTIALGWLGADSANELGHEWLALNALTPIERRQTFVDSPAKLSDLVVLFEEQQCLSNHFTGGVVAASLHLVLDEFFQLGSEVNVHRVPELTVAHASIPVNVDSAESDFIPAPPDV